MKVILRISTAIIIALIFSTTASFACSSDCSTLTGITMPASAVTLVTDAIHYTQSGIVLTSHASCDLLHETSNQLAALPDALNSSMAQAENSSSSLFESSLNLLRAATGAVIKFSSSLLRIVFSSFSAHA